MNKMSDHDSCKLAKGFTTGEKTFAQFFFNAFWITGFIAIWQDSVLWALAYAVLVAYGVFGLIVRHLVCPRCPHLYKYNDCLQAPKSWVKAIVKKPTSAHMTKGQKVLGAITLLTISLLPLIWLWDKPYYLAVYLVFCGAWWAGQVYHFCKQCRVSSCPFNRSGVPV
jgi:hypothetical protein